MANVRITGTNFSTATDGPVDHVGIVFAAITSRDYYDPLGPNAGLNPGGSTILTWTETIIEINDPVFDGETITDVFVEDFDGDYNVTFDVTPDLVVPPPLTYPVLTGICSPAADTIRFEGTNFLLATAGPIGYIIPRLADYASGALLNGPNMIVDLSNVPANWTLVSHTDNEITLSNPDFTSEEPSGGPGDFVVTGAAFHDAIDQTFYYYLEPWGETFSTPVDGAGCAAPVILAASSPSSQRVVLTGTDLDQIGRLDVVHSGGGVNWYNELVWMGGPYNDPALIINQWDANTIDIEHGFVAGFTFQTVTAYDLTNEPSGVLIALFDVPDFVIQP